MAASRCVRWSAAVKEVSASGWLGAGFSLQSHVRSQSVFQMSSCHSLLHFRSRYRKSGHVGQTHCSVARAKGVTHCLGDYRCVSSRAVAMHALPVHFFAGTLGHRPSLRCGGGLSRTAVLVIERALLRCLGNQGFVGEYPKGMAFCREAGKSKSRSITLIVLLGFVGAHHLRFAGRIFWLQYDSRRLSGLQVGIVCVAASRGRDVGHVARPAES